MTSTPTRRAALTGGATVGLAGLFGTRGATAASAAPAATPARLTTTLPVPAGATRTRPAAGDRLAHRVALFDADGAEVGELVVTGTVLAARGPSGTTAAVHHHLVRLPGGTLAGHGTVDLAGHGEFVVVGGTGAHRGATGSYLLHPGPGRGSTLVWEA